MLVSVTVWVGLPLDFCLREVWNVGPAREWSMWVYNPNECWSNGGYVFSVECGEDTPTLNWGDRYPLG